MPHFFETNPSTLSDVTKAAGSFQIDPVPPHPSAVVTLSFTPLQSLVYPVHTNSVRGNHELKITTRVLKVTTRELKVTTRVQSVLVGSYR
jgi:hypothetical protein